jgi:anti-sigma regulatory factor (Ser/Thr protein kinase)
MSDQAGGSLRLPIRRSIDRSGAGCGPAKVLAHIDGMAADHLSNVVGIAVVQNIPTVTCSAAKLYNETKIEISNHDIVDDSGSASVNVYSNIAVSAGRTGPWHARRFGRYCLDGRSPRDRLSDLVHRMRQTALSMLETEGRRVEFIAPAEEQIERVELTPDLRRHLWLFFKEAVTNVARHSGATDVSVDFTLGPRQLRLAIRDNGCGFDPEATVSGQGLRSLRHRTAEMRGELRLDSAAGRGTEIELLVPLPA